MADYKRIAGSKIQFELTLTKEDVQKAQKGFLEQAKKNVKIRGFRPGKAPESAVIAHIGLEQLSLESFNRALDKHYQVFIRTHEIAPINAPEVDIKDLTNLPTKATIIVEVYPEVDITGYDKIKTTPVKVEVTDKEVNDAIETFISSSNAGKEVTRAAKKNDQVVLDFRATDKDGNFVPKTEGTDVPVRLGLGHFIPEMEKAILGMKPGDKKEKEPVKFPKDYHAKDIAGEKVFFDITVKKVIEISAENLDAETIKAVTGDDKKTPEQFRADIKDLIKKNKSQTEIKTKIEEYQKDLAKKVKADLPDSWLARDVAARMEQMKAAPEYVANPDKFWERLGKKEKDLEAQFTKEAESGMKSYLALTKIIEKENIELDKDEIATVNARTHKRVSENTSIDEERLRDQEILNAKIDKFLHNLFV